MIKYKKKPKAVVLDIDDTITGFVEMLVFLHNQLHGTVISTSNINQYDLKEIELTDSSGKEVKKGDLWDTFQKYEDEGGFYALLEPLNYAVEALNLIKKLGYHVILLTARNPKFELQTVANLAKYKVKYDDLIFDHEKAKVVRKLSKIYNVQVFADDKAETCNDIVQNTNVNKVYLVWKAHNKDVEVDEDVIRIDKVFDIIQSLKDVNN